jgi:hypothetical protein
MRNGWLSFLDTPCHHAACLFAREGIGAMRLGRRQLGRQRRRKDVIGGGLFLRLQVQAQPTFRSGDDRPRRGDLHSDVFASTTAADSVWAMAQTRLASWLWPSATSPQTKNSWNRALLRPGFMSFSCAARPTAVAAKKQATAHEPTTATSRRRVAIDFSAGFIRGSRKRLLSHNKSESATSAHRLRISTLCRARGAPSD